MIVADPADSTAAAAGFSVPQGDPGELRSAASQWSTLQHALDNAKSSVTAASERSLDTGGWTGAAASAFTAHATIIVGAIVGGMEAAVTTHAALDALASELEHVQSVTRGALADYNSAAHTYNTQSATAATAGLDASDKETQASAATHPATKAELNTQAATSRQDETTANNAATRASGDMTAATTRGQHAITAYDTAVAQIEIRLRQAAGALVTIPDGGSWGDLVLKFIDDALTFSGGLTFVGKRFEAQFASGVKTFNKEFDDWRDSPAVIKAIDHGEIPPEPVSNDPGEFDRLGRDLKTTEAVENNGWVKLLSRGWTDDGSVVSKVPVVAQLLTGFEIYENLHDHENPVKAIGEPVANLAAGTTVAEVTSSGLASLLEATGGAGVEIMGTTMIPGVGEVVIVGAVTVVAVYTLDKVATYVWDHPNQAAHDITSSPAAPVLAANPVTAPVVGVAWAWEHKSQIAHDAGVAGHAVGGAASGAWHDATHPVSTVKSIAHDLGL